MTNNTVCICFAISGAIRRIALQDLCLFVQDVLIFPLIRSTGMITLGSQHRSIDYKAVWSERMQVPDTLDHLLGKHKGV